MSLLVRVLLYSLPALVALVGGGALASWRPPGPALRSAILHFAAGVVFSVVAVELLPDIVKEHQPVPVVIGFALGVAVMLGLKHLLEKGEEGESSSSAGMLTGVRVDIAIDGLLLGIGFSAGAKEGILHGAWATFRFLRGSWRNSFESLAAFPSGDGALVRPCRAALSRHRGASRRGA